MFQKLNSSSKYYKSNNKSNVEIRALIKILNYVVYLQSSKVL